MGETIRGDCRVEKDEVAGGVGSWYPCLDGQVGRSRELIFYRHEEIALKYATKRIRRERTLQIHQDEERQQVHRASMRERFRRWGPLR
jgi:hypothetical protein